MTDQKPEPLSTWFYRLIGREPLPDTWADTLRKAEYIVGHASGDSLPRAIALSIQEGRELQQHRAAPVEPVRLTLDSRSLDGLTQAMIDDDTELQQRRAAQGEPPTPMLYHCDECGAEWAAVMFKIEVIRCSACGSLAVVEKPAPPRMSEDHPAWPATEYDAGGPWKGQAALVRELVVATRKRLRTRAFSQEGMNDAECETIIHGAVLDAMALSPSAPAQGQAGVLTDQQRVSNALDATARRLEPQGAKTCATCRHMRIVDQTSVYNYERACSYPGSPITHIPAMPFGCTLHEAKP